MINSFALISLLFACFSAAAPYPTRQRHPINRRDIDTDPSHCPNFCAGTNSTDNSTLYICGDPRLGPVSLPTALPLASLAGSASSYHRFGGMCPGDFLARYTDPTTGFFVYPILNGFHTSTIGAPIAANMTLQRGTLLDRFGSERGNFMSPAGSPYAQRSLPPSNLDAAPGAEFPWNYHVYEVEVPFVVLAGPIAPWFGQVGLGVQFQMEKSVQRLVEGGWIGRVNLTAVS
ncbi:uncharacterized protein BDZ99DRAFT_493191 [Mytilinidion resinicola]|uniref:TNT domain-containing protein n=1 Tax=Mytilinidion resinicola TaxID=574789 RepID=A0A6A6ZAM7_9PEZI|nr:uncharacterized protein BDZ99DRAFT_493191 [Mytilinidion resinicola]KAF2817354.1 hypothetical protein BDZ99DRAFT_493191 [Mytilinidion resinicola]